MGLSNGGRWTARVISINHGCLRVVITVRQTVQVDGGEGSVAITGTTQLELECGKGAAGRACEASARVEATVDGETSAALGR